MTPADPTPSSVAGLYRDHHRWLIGWLQRRLGYSQQAADLTQDTFVRLLAKDDMPSLREPRAFLTTVAKRVLSNHWRRDQLEQAYLAALAAQPEPVAMSPEEHALLIATLVEVDQLLDGLPAQVRHAFLLAQLEGLNQADIAERLAISLSTVKRHLRRAALQCYFALETA